MAAFLDMNDTAETSDCVDAAINFLLGERPDLQAEHDASHHDCGCPVEYHDEEIYKRICTLKTLLCARRPVPEIPDAIVRRIDRVLDYEKKHKLLTRVSKLPHVLEVAREGNGAPPIKISLWKGDITTLTDVSAIVNAANSEMLGCFRPHHLCIDNAIHSAAGPRLREVCYRHMEQQEHEQPVGSAAVTFGFSLPATRVIHVVGPQLPRWSDPSKGDCEDLAKCYTSCLDAAEKLPAIDGEVSIAFCGISTGVFAFPERQAAGIAVTTVIDWCLQHHQTPLTKIVFDVFSEEAREIYSLQLERTAKALAGRGVSYAVTQAPLTSGSAIYLHSLEVIKQWLNDAEYLIIAAGPGLSAAVGLDLSSPTLFRNHFSTLTPLGSRNVREQLSTTDWPSEYFRWGFIFGLLHLARSWAPTTAHQQLLDLTRRFGKNHHIRTSTPDGLFVSNGFDPAHVSTPNGEYKYLQCQNQCDPEAVYESKPYVDAAPQVLSKRTGGFINDFSIPRCGDCDGPLDLCTRDRPNFNEKPYAEGEARWRDVVRQTKFKDPKRTVILELGEDTETPGTIRWPNERLVSGEDDSFKLIRVGTGAAGWVSEELEESGSAIGVEGDVGDFIAALHESVIGAG